MDRCNTNPTNSRGASEAPAPMSLARRHLHAACASLDVVHHAPSVSPTRHLTDALAQSLSTPQYRRTFVQGCACSTGFAGGGCCPSGASGLAMQAGCGAHGLMGLVGGAFGTLGLYGGVKVVRNSTDATRQLTRVQDALAPQMQTLSRLRGEQNDAAVPHVHLDRQLSASRLWAEALRRSASEQRFNFWVPGVLQSMAASSAMLVAARHAGLVTSRLVGGAWLGTTAPALFALYGFLLAAKHVYELRCAPDGRAAPSESAAHHAQEAAFARQAAGYAQSRRTSVRRTAYAWGLVGMSGVLGSLVSAGLWTQPWAPVLALVVGAGAAGFAMWQNSQTRFVPHLPISPHVSFDMLTTAHERQTTMAALTQQSAAITQAAQALYAEQPWRIKAAHLAERMLRPQCGPTANQVLATAVAASPDDAQKSRHQRLLQQAAQTWCAAELTLTGERLAVLHTRLQADVDALDKHIAPPDCGGKRRRMRETLTAQGADAQIITRAAAFLRDEAEHAETLRDKHHALMHLASQLQSIAEADSDDETERLWVRARLCLLQLSGTMGDAVDGHFIQTHQAWLTQLTTPDALPINNVMVAPKHLEAFADALAPTLDGAFVHAFFNTRRIEAEMDYILEFDAMARAHSEAAPAAPVCIADTCCG